MQGAYRSAAERADREGMQISDIFEALLAQLDEVNSTAEDFDRAMGALIQRGGRTG
jgi:hypothetical protein